METEVKDHLASLKIVTPVSRYLALVLFIMLPFLGGLIGYNYAPSEVTEIEKIIIKEIPQVSEVAGEEFVKISMTNNSDVLEQKMGFVSTMVSPEFSVINNGQPDENNVTPIEHVFVTGLSDIDVYVGNAGANCQLQDRSLDHPELKNLISNETAIVSQLYCWYAGGGMKYYLFEIPEKSAYNVAYHSIDSCGADPECVPYGQLQVLW